MAHQRETENLRYSQGTKQEGKVEWLEEHNHRLVPYQDDQDTIHPTWDLRNAGHGRPFGLDIICVRIAAEPRGDIELFDL